MYYVLHFWCSNVLRTIPSTLLVHNPCAHSTGCHFPAPSSHALEPNVPFPLHASVHLLRAILGGVACKYLHKAWMLSAMACRRARKTAKTYEAMTNLGKDRPGGKGDDEEREKEKREALEQATVMVRPCIGRVWGAE